MPELPSIVRVLSEPPLKEPEIPLLPSEVMILPTETLPLLGVASDRTGMNDDGIWIIPNFRKPTVID